MEAKVELLEDPTSGQVLDTRFYFGATNQFAVVGHYQNQIYTVDKNDKIETISGNYRSAINIVNNRLFFASGKYGEMRLYVSDGTAKGTNKISDMGAETYGSQITQIIENGNRAAFLHRNNGQWSQGVVTLWQSDGSAKGTRMLLDSLSPNYPDTTWSKTRGSAIMSHKGNVYTWQPDSTQSVLYKVSNKASVVKILAFLDEDADGEKDSNEDGIDDMELTVGIGELKLWTNSDGMANINLDPGKYAINSSIVGDGWKIGGAGSSGFEFQLPRDKGKTIYLAIQKTKNSYENEVRLGFARQRCGFTVPFWLNARNSGTLASNVEMKLILDSQVSYVSASVTPDSLDTVSNCFLWKFSDMKPLTNNKVKLFARMPGVNSMGDKLKYALYLTSKDGGVKYADTLVVEDSLTCAYDPNDKQVFPQRDLGGIYKGEKLKYKIRFQNTGNDTAINIKLIDTLSKNLDLSTLKILGSSHSLETHLNDVGVLTFFFDDIYLADSNTNEPESHGFVDYEVSPKSSLVLGDEVENTAYIYFDFNPPIVTNTTYNVRTKRPVGISSNTKVSDHIAIFPNPMDDQLYIRFDNERDRLVEVTNAVGVRLYSTTSRGKLVDLETSEWSTGIYMIRVSEGENTEVFKVIKE